MQNLRIALLIIIILLLIAGVGLVSMQLGPGNSTSSNTINTATTSSGNYTITLSDSIVMPNVGERFDHMSMNLQSQLVYVVARGNNSVYVVSLVTEGVTHVITGLNEPQGVIYASNKIFVSNGGDGSVYVYDAANYSLIDKLSFSSDADNMRYYAGFLYVGYGEENQSGIAIVNTSSDAIVGLIHLEGHPESFALEQNSTKMYVNVPTTSSIVVVDRTNRSVVATWQTGSNIENFPMALDEKDHRLFVGFWYPTDFAVYNTETGKVVANLNMSSDADDIYYDPLSGLILASCGQGFVDVIRQQNVDSYQYVSSIPTTPIARTSLFVPQLEKLFVAAPQNGDHSAQLLIFDVQSG
ncbi:MAG: YncE family protein [Nitrososphaerales archaeon]